MKKLQINEDQLELLLEKRKKHIGGNAIANTSLSIAITLLITYLTADYKDLFGIQGLIIEKFFVVIMIILFVAAVLLYVFDRYNHTRLLNEIIDLSTLKNEYRMIAIIKDTFNSYSNRFLVYHDTIWHCFLFPHFPISNNTIPPKEDEMTKFISNELKVPIKNISTTFICKQEEHIKFSLRNNEDKNYHFYYFSVKIDNINLKSPILQDSFSIHKKAFVWKSISELRQDESTMSNNSDVINFVESHKWSK